MLTIQKNLTTINRTIKSNRDIKYIVVHYTGNAGDTAFNNAKYFKSEYRGSSAHYFVDENSIWQCVADKDVAWHCGTSGIYYHAECRNANSIGVEMCNSVSRNLAVERNTVELVRYLMGKYGVDIDHVVRHYDVTRKRCPAELVDNGEWIDFKNKITGGNDEMTEAEKAKMRAIDDSLSNLYRIVQDMKERNPVYKTIADVPDWGRTVVQKLVDCGILHGDENGDINVSGDMLRGMVIMERMLERR